MQVDTKTTKYIPPKIDKKPVAGQKTSETKQQKDTSPVTAPKGESVELSKQAKEKLQSEPSQAPVTDNSGSEPSVYNKVNKWISDKSEDAYKWVTGKSEDDSKYVDQDSKDKWLAKLKKSDPERYKTFMKNQIDAEITGNETSEKSGQLLQEGIEKANPDVLLKSAITGVDQYELQKQNEETDKKQMELAKNKSSDKSHVSNLLNSQEDINKSNLASAEATQKLANEIDVMVTLGASGNLVDAKNAYNRGDYKEAALDVGYAGVKVAGSALLYSGVAVKWAGQGLSKLGVAGDKLLKSVAPEAYQAVKSGAGAAKELVTEGVFNIADKIAKPLTNLDGKTLLYTPVKELGSKGADEITSFLGKTAQETWDILTMDAGKAAYNTAGKATGKVLNKIGQTGENLLNKIGDAGDGLKGLIDDAGKGIKNTINRAGNSVDELLAGNKSGNLKELLKDVDDGIVDVKKLHEAFKKGDLKLEELRELCKDGKITSRELLDIKGTNFKNSGQIETESAKTSVSNKKLYNNTGNQVKPEPEIRKYDRVKTEEKISKMPEPSPEPSNKVDMVESGEIDEAGNVYTHEPTIEGETVVKDPGGSGTSSVSRKMREGYIMKEYKRLRDAGRIDEATQLWKQFLRDKENGIIYGLGENSDIRNI